MPQTICDKCSGPVTPENGKYTCVLCGATYGTYKVETETDLQRYDAFYNSVSLEDFRRIAGKLSNSVALGYGYQGKDSSRNNTLGLTYIIARLSDGRYFTHFNKGNGFDSIYRGQCEVGDWIGVEKVYADQGAAIGITSEGELLPTLEEAYASIERIKKRKISDMRIKKICTSYYKNDDFLGLDVDGKVVVSNPLSVFSLDKSSQKDVSYCAGVIKEIKSWPPLKDLCTEFGLLAGVAETGEVYSIATSEFRCQEYANTVEFLRSQKDVESIAFHDQPGGDFRAPKVPVVLKKDGQIITQSDQSSCSGRDNVVQLMHFWNSNCAVLTRDGSLYVGNKKMAENVVAIIPDWCDRAMGYVKTDGSVYARQVLGQSEFTKIEKLKLFASLDTLEEDWAAVKKLETAHIESIKRQINMANYELGEARKKHEAAKSELKTAEQTLSSLGILKIKEKMQLKEKIESLKHTIQETGYDISDIEEKRKRLQGGAKRWRYIDLQAQYDEAVYQVRSMMNQSAVTSTPKNSSVLKSAAVGAIVAGPAGAVVGAIYAADKNRKNNSK